MIAVSVLTSVWIAAPHDHGAVAEPIVAGAVVQGIMLVATAFVAGIAILRPVAGPPNRAGRWLINAATGTAVVTQLMAVDLAAGSTPFLVGLAAATIGTRLLLVRVGAAAAAGAALAVALAWVSATAWGSHTAAHLVVGLVHGVSIAALIGAAGYLTTADSGERAALARRLAPWLLAAAGVTAASAAAHLLLGWGGAFMLAELVAAGLCAAVLLSVRRRPARVATTSARATVARAERLAVPAGLLRVQAIGLVATVLIGVTAGVIAAPAGPEPGVPVLHTVTVSGQRLPVFVVPARPGWNLVHVGADRVTAGTDPARLAPAAGRPGTTQAWAPVWLPAGRSRVWVGYQGATASLPVDTGPASVTGPDLRGPDGPECATFALGQAIAGAAESLGACPADRLAPADAAALRAMVRFVAGRGVSGFGLVSDSSPRAVEAEAVVRAEADRAGLTVGSPGQRPASGQPVGAGNPVVIVSGWAAAEAAIREVGTGRLRAQGTYLAPWLLNAVLLDTPAGQLLPLRFDTADARAMRYVAVLGDAFPGAPATAASFTGWLRADLGAEPVRLHAASRVSVPGLPAQHAHTSGRWLPSGAIVAVTGPLDEA